MPSAARRRAQAGARRKRELRHCRRAVGAGGMRLPRCCGLGFEECFLVTAALAGTAAYIVAVTVGALGMSRAGGLCDDHPDCAVEFGAWLAANALIGIGMCALALSLCACASCSSKRGLTPRCRSVFAISAIIGLVVVAASTITGGVVMWHPQKCFASCDLASKVRLGVRRRAADAAALARSVCPAPPARGQRGRAQRALCGRAASKAQNQRLWSWSRFAVGRGAPLATAVAT